MVEILESNEDELNNTFIIDRVTFNHESSTRHFAIIFELNVLVPAIVWALVKSTKF